MNVFRVQADRADEFVCAWRERDSFLDGVDGFESFHLLQGKTEDGVSTFSSHTVWQDEASFRAWVDSEAFRKAHAQGSLRGILAGPPNLQLWTSVPMNEPTGETTS